MKLFVAIQIAPCNLLLHNNESSDVDDNDFDVVGDK